MSTTSTPRRRASRRLQARLLRWPALYHTVRWGRMLGRFVARRSHSPHYAAFGLFPERTGAFLDVGANVGTSAMSFRAYNRRAPIISVEANPDHERALRFVGKLVRRFSFHILGAGSEQGTATLRIPYYGSISLTGLASMESSSLTESVEWWIQDVLGDADASVVRYHSIEVPVVPLDSLGLSPDFVKIDVEGYEMQALQGLQKTMERSRPIILVEANEGRADMIQFMESHDFVAKTYSPSSGQFGEPDESCGPNLFFIPAEEWEIRRPAITADDFAGPDTPRGNRADEGF